MHWEENRGLGQDPATPLASSRSVSSLTVTVLMVTFNRLRYTQLAVEAMLQSEHPSTEFVVWDNASSDGTRTWLVDNLAKDPRVSLILSSRNVGSTHPMNVVWGSARTPLLAKIDNDTLVPRSLIGRLVECHASHPHLGVVSGCHFQMADMQAVVQQHSKLHEGESILRVPHVGGCAVMMKRSLFAEFGPVFCQRYSSQEPYLESGWTDYQERLTRAGYINGYPLPLMPVDHMEDTRSPHHADCAEDQNYKLLMRGLSLEECTQQLYRAGADKLSVRGQPELLHSNSVVQFVQGQVTLFIPLAGRAEHWPQLASFLERQTWSRQRTRLILLDTSQNAAFFDEISQWVKNCDYDDVAIIRQIVGSVGLADLPRREATTQVRAAMAQIYNQLKGYLATEYVWILEDDILPPEDVCQRLMLLMDERVCSAAAPYRSRFGDRMVAWDRSGRNYLQPNKETPEVGGNGFGCVLLRSSVFSQVTFDPQHDCDRQLYEEMQSTSWRARMDWTCECHHGLINEPLLVQPAMKDSMR